MPLDVTFTLSDDDLERFQSIVDKARSALETDDAARQIEDAARKLIKEIDAANLPDFISSRMQKLGVVLDMINDDEWQLSDDERRQVLSALAYLVDSEDLIPDHIPGLGFLDDAIYAEIVINELRNEIEPYGMARGQACGITRTHAQAPPDPRREQPLAHAALVSRADPQSIHFSTPSAVFDSAILQSTHFSTRGAV